MITGGDIASYIFVVIHLVIWKGNFLNEEIQPKHFFIVNEFMKEVKNIYVMEANRNLRDDLLFLETVYKREEEKKEIIENLNELGINVKDIIVDDSSDKPKFYFVRIINGKEYKLDLFDESEGLLSLVYLIPLINVFLAVGSTFIIDELDAHLHPKILQEIIKRFQSKSNTYSQLIFTSHDITNMDNDIFRRDEVWFVVKEEDYSSNIYSLTDIVNYKGEKVRKDAKFSKQYLEGRYGALPFIK